MPIPQLVSLDDVCRLTALGQSSVYFLIRESDFPKPIKFGRRSRWVESEVYDWIARRQVETARRGAHRAKGQLGAMRAWSGK